MGKDEYQDIDRKKMSTDDGGEQKTQAWESPQEMAFLGWGLSPANKGYHKPSFYS